MGICMLHTRLHAYTCTAHTFSSLAAIICLSRRFLLSTPPLRMTAPAAQAAHLRIMFSAQTFFTLTRIAESLADRKKKEWSDGQTHGLSNGGRQVSECGDKWGELGVGRVECRRRLVGWRSMTRCQLQDTHFQARARGGLFRGTQDVS